MTKINTTWLCAIILASGKTLLRDVTPNDLENFDQFVAGLSRRELIELDDALEFAECAMSEVEGDEAIALTREIGKMWEIVFDALTADDEIKDATGNLIGV